MPIFNVEMLNKNLFTTKDGDTSMSTKFQSNGNGLNDQVKNIPNLE